MGDHECLPSDCRDRKILTLPLWHRVLLKPCLRQPSVSLAAIPRSCRLQPLFRARSIPMRYGCKDLLTNSPRSSRANLMKGRANGGQFKSWWRTSPPGPNAPHGGNQCDALRRCHVGVVDRVHGGGTAFDRRGSRWICPRQPPIQFRDQGEPLTVTVSADGTIYVQETPVEYENLVPRLEAIATAGYDQRIFIRGDQNRAYGDVVKVMGRINAAGFTRIGLVTEQETE